MTEGAESDCAMERTTQKRLGNAGPGNLSHPDFPNTRNFKTDASAWSDTDKTQAVNVNMTWWFVSDKTQVGLRRWTRKSSDACQLKSEFLRIRRP